MTPEIDNAPEMQPGEPEPDPAMMDEELPEETPARGVARAGPGARRTDACGHRNGRRGGA